MNENDMRKLWPGGRTRKLAPSIGVSTLPTKPPLASGGFEREIVFPIRRFPPIGANETGYLRYYIQTGGAVKVVAPPGNAANAFTATWSTDTGAKEQAMIAKYEKQLNDYVTFEGNLAPSRSACHKFASGDWEGAAKEVFAGHLKGGGKIFWNVQGEVDVEISPDDNFCFFAVTLKVQIPFNVNDVMDVISSAVGGRFDRNNNVLVPNDLKLELEGAVTIRFGLSKKGWVAVARQTSGSALKAAANTLPQTAARSSIIGALEVFGIPMIGAAAGVGLMYLTGVMACYYSTKGTRLGILNNYCTGYVVKVFEERTGERGHHTSNKIRTRGTVASSEHYMSGYEDAANAITTHGVGQIENTLLRNFGTARYWSLQGRRAEMIYGDTIDKEYEEAREIANKMAADMTDNIDEVAKFVGISNVGWQYW